MIKPELAATICPFMRTMLTAQDAPPWNKAAQEMEVSDLVGFVQAQQSEHDGSLRDVLKFFAVSNHGVPGQSGRFSTHLTGSKGDHKGGSEIYTKSTGEFNQDEFQKFTVFGSDGRMDHAQLGKAIVDANKRHGGSPVDAVKSAGEFALLSALLGDGNGTITIDDMSLLFKENEFPNGARANLRNRTAGDWFDFTGKIVRAISAEAIRIAHHQGEMQLQKLTQEAHTRFASLI
jgi:hypothetical protein